MSERDYTDYLHDISGSIALIKDFTRGFSLEQFRNDHKTQYATIRCFEIIGEAVKKIPEDYRKNTTSINWKVLAGMRDRLIHGYDVVDVAILWRTIINDIPVLEKEINKLLK
jgi:uncharacterized protein with HEPN domain